MKTPPHSNGASSANSKKEPRKTRQSRSREAELREHGIHSRIAQRMRDRKKNPMLPLWNAKTLGEEMEYSQHCIQNDIRQMRLKGYPIEFDTKLNGFYYSESFTPVLTQPSPKANSPGFPRVPRRCSSQGLSLLRIHPGRLEKLNEALANRFNLDYASFSQCITFRSTGIDAMLDPAIFETLITAIRERQELEIVYSKLNHDDETCSNDSLSRSPGDPREDASPSSVHCPPSSVRCPLHTAFLPHPAAPWLSVPVETRIVHPLHLLSHDNALYLFLWDTKRKDIRCFALSRMRSVRPNGKSSKPHKFDLEEEIRDLFGVTSGEPVDIRIQFRRKASMLVAERPWHHSQKLTPGPDNEWNLELTMRVAFTPELERWLFGFHEDARVMEPADLRDAIAAKAAAIRRNHNVPA